MGRILFITMCVLLVTALCFGQGSNRKQLLAIDIPMDRFSIEYWLFEDGSATNVRYVSNWAFQASAYKQLTKTELRKVQALIKQPPAQTEKVAKDSSVVVMLYEKGKSRKVTYDRKKLPLQMKELMVLLGGIRFELARMLTFDTRSLVLDIRIKLGSGDIIHYEVFNNGFEDDFRENYDTPWGDGRYQYLSKDTLGQVRLLVGQLPACAMDIPDKQLVTVTIYEKGKAKETRYDRTTLPAGMKKLLDVLGGVRPEIKDQVQFAVER
ncbi:MAG: hypothetical protein ACYDBB_17265 [Armatimonadota bacterium]